MTDRIPPGPDTPDIAAVDRLTAKRDQREFEDSFYLELDAINDELAAQGLPPVDAAWLAREQELF